MKIIEQQSTCKECNAPFASHCVSGDFLGASLSFATNYCESCLREKLVGNASCADNIQPKAEWGEICPKCYQNFDLASLPESSRKIANRVFAWQSQSKGIGLFGQSRTGKTFILHELMRRHYESGARVHLTSANEFAWQMGSIRNNDRENEMEKCLRADLLLFDDIGKEKITERYEADLYRVFEQRRRALKPVFTSVNSSGNTLADAMSDDGGWPIVNRLKFDLCEFVKVPDLPKSI